MSRDREDRGPEAGEGLEPSSLLRACDPETLGFESTDEVEETREVVGQPRASRAVSFGIALQGEGFNVFALGPEETDKRRIVERFLRDRAREEPPPPDLCYVNDFDAAHRPRALLLPPGRGRELARDMDAFLEGIVPTVRAAFESEEYQARRQALQEELNEDQEEEFEALQEKARARGLALVRTPSGFVFAALRDGEVVSPQEIEGRPPEERKALEAHVEELQGELQAILRKVPRRQRRLQEEVRELDHEIARLTVGDHLSELRERYGDAGEAAAYLGAVEEHLVAHVHELLQADRGGGRPGGGQAPALGSGAGPLERPEVRRYRVNLLVDHGSDEHAPVIYENHPTYPNLVGRIEYQPVLGALVTDFNLIKAGALHRANGGYLVLDLHRVVSQPLAWEGLKRALQAGEIRVESPGEAIGMVSTVRVDPEPVPLRLKVVLLGSRLHYSILSRLDPDFPELFKVAADFDDRMDRSPEGERTYARLVAGLVRREELRPFDRTAVARVVERAAREADDQEKLSTRIRPILDLMREADHWAAEGGRDRVAAGDVDRAVEEWTYRASLARDRVHEEIERNTILIDTDRSVVGQVNGLSVARLGDFSFGRPTRITGRARLGTGEVVDIEREVELGGPLHSKGVLILSSFLSSRYCPEHPLSLSASLVFEQSYGGVEGDSASCAELFALLSALGEIPLRQSVAVTGSMNQHGVVQAIGGANEKIEGFFDVCRGRELTGEQGVLIPRANVKHLMLRRDVVEAVAEGRFHVWPIDHVDRGIERLTGLAAGEREADGPYPEGSVNRRVEDRLLELAERRRSYHRSDREDAG